MKIATNGCFDLFHDGHKYILGIAMDWTDTDEFLILLNSDSSVKEHKGETRPIDNHDQRRHNILSWITENYPMAKGTITTFSTEQELEELINEFEPDLILKGNDRTDVKEIVGSQNWPVCILPRLEKDGKPISTTALLK